MDSIYASPRSISSKSRLSSPDIDLSGAIYSSADIELGPNLGTSSPDRLANVYSESSPLSSPDRAYASPMSSPHGTSKSPGVIPPPLIFELLSRNSAAHKSKMVYQFFDDGNAPTPSRALTYGDLDSRTRALALELLARPGPEGGAKPLLKRGDRVMLVFLPSLDFIIAFLACLRAGIIPVPCYPPDPRNLRVNVTLFAAVCASCGAKVALTHASYTSLVSLASMKENALKWLGLGGKGGPKWPELGWWDVEEATKKGGAGATPHLAALNAASLDTLTTGSSSDLAFLQYTSGSTSEPKGVRITHANLAHNLRTIVTSLAAGSDTVVASWLPQYHDMGLIGSYLGVMACGGSGVYMSPLSFLKAPLAWIAMISKYKATHIQAPNFAYSLVARRWRELPTSERSKLSLNTNLSSIRHAFNAAESVTTHSCAEFFAAFVPCGLSPRAMSPGFGLAENTVYVSDGGRNVVWVDREILEEEGKAHVLATVPLTSLLNPEAIAAIESTQAVGGGVPDSSSTSLGRTTNQGGKQSRRIGSYVACGPVATPPGLTPMASIGTTTSSVLGAKNRDVWVLVVNPTTHLPAPQEGTVGEVWVHSPSTADGYEGKEEATQEAFKAHLAENSFSFFPPPSAPTPTPRISPITAAVAGLSSITLPGRAPPLPPAAALRCAPAPLAAPPAAARPPSAAPPRPRSASAPLPPSAPAPRPRSAPRARPLPASRARTQSPSAGPPLPA